MSLTIQGACFKLIGYSSKIEFVFNWSMDFKEEQTIKAQEWVVMFDGKIKKSETEIDANEHHSDVNNQKTE